MSRQLVFELGHRSAHGRDDFLVAPSNKLAVALIDAWPAWPAPVVALSGPQGSGKTHLAEVWHAMSGAVCFEASVLDNADVPALVARGRLIIEDIETLSDTAERNLFHLLNLVKEEGASMLLTSRKAPAHLGIKLPDLSSRLKAPDHLPRLPHRTQHRHRPRYGRGTGPCFPLRQTPDHGSAGGSNS